MRYMLVVSMLLLTVLPERPARAADPAQGKKLHDAHCTTCHGTNVYSRPDRKIKSLAALNERLIACTHAAQVELSDAEQKSIVQYLNEQFYKFK